ncbi:MAG: hypothetical protein LBL81_00715, partial [Tannerella sp.]|nr:hypothetical protein [Tannerella sp.]
MKKTIYTKCLFVALLLLPCSLFAQTGKRPWMDDKLPVARRVELVLAAMTPEEKIALLTENWGVPAIPRLGIPAIKKV